jgi:hypothetical protein
MRTPTPTSTAPSVTVSGTQAPRSPSLGSPGTSTIAESVTSAVHNSPATSPSSIVAGAIDILAQVINVPLLLLHGLQQAEPQEPHAAEPLDPGSSEAAPPFQFIHSLPTEMITEIFTYLNPRSAAQFAQTSSTTQDVYKQYLFEKTLFTLIDKPIHTATERIALVKAYSSIVSSLLDKVLAPQSNVDELSNMAGLVEKFFKVFSKQEMGTFLSQVLRLNPQHLQEKFERLADINLSLTISLITSLSLNASMEFKLNHDFLSEKIPLDKNHIQGFVDLLALSPQSSALHFAMHSGSIDTEQFRDIAHILIGSNATATATINSINMSDIKGNTLLIQACAEHDLDAINIVEELLEYQADINVQNKQGFTALMYAAKYRTDATVELLLSHSADKSLKNNAGQTALMLAQERGDEGIIRLLEADHSM